ncbi:MAG: cupin domain-containing protein [Pseudomonadota bacterium]
MPEVKMNKIESRERRVANIHTDAFKPWLSEGGKPTGESLIQLNDSHPDGVGFHIYKMEPGTSSRPHTHEGDEEFFMISGELIDNDGTVYRTGDLVWLKRGTQHSSYTKDGCVIAVYIPKAETMLDK